MCIDQTIIGKKNWKPNLLLDDGGDLTKVMHEKYKNILKDVNSLTGLIFNLFNFISIGAAVLYRNNSYILLLILIINLIIYNFIYFKLKDNNL